MPDRISCIWVPSPQSNMKASPSRIRTVDERPRYSVGMAELVPSVTIFIPNADYHGQAELRARQSTRSCLACGAMARGVGFGPAAGLVDEVFDEVILETPVLEDGSPAIEYCEQ